MPTGRRSFFRLGDTDSNEPDADRRRPARSRVHAFDRLEARALLTINAPAADGPWTQVFADEFNTLNPSVWTNDEFWGNTNTTFSGVFTPGNANVSGGDLNLTAERRNTVGSDGKTYPVASGRVQTGGIQGVTAPGFAFEYGYVDVRMKANSGNGLWSAAWMLPVSHQDGYEIDLVENIGTQPRTYAGGYHDWRDRTWAWGRTPLSFNDTQDYHDYAVDWEPGSLKFYVDGLLVRSYTGSDVPSQPMYLVLNLDVGSYAGDPTRAPALDTMSVDSVAVWQHTPSAFLSGQGVGGLANPAPGQFGDPGFEMEQVHGDSGPAYILRPSDPYWTFNDASGLESNGSALGAASAPQGSQAAFVQVNPAGVLGQVAQTLNVPTAGSYAIAFQAARQGTGGVQPIAVSVDGVVVATVTPASTSFSANTTPAFNLNSGRHTIAFTATTKATSATSFIDAVSLNPEGSQAPASPYGITAAAASSTAVNLSWADGAGVATGFLIQLSTDGTTFATAATASAGATTYQLTGLKPSTLYTFRVLAQNSAGSSPPSNTAQATTLPVPIPAPWTAADVGSPALTGSTMFSADLNTITVTGSGTGIRGTSDQFQFADQATTGSTTVSARLVSQSGTDAWAKSGVMIRATSDPGSAYVAVEQTVGNGLGFEWRTATGAMGQYLENLPVVSGPVYIKLVRSGNTFTGAYSLDGSTYTQLGTVTIVMPSSTLSGLAVTSHSPALVNAAVFDNVKVSSP